ncbi:PHP domain-containing protein [Nocardioides sp.]|uniref:PHP domain-containing protein n=1 Tax=Nocardioides sp. TaxID=35761 RepID=UPI0035292738
METVPSPSSYTALTSHNGCPPVWRVKRSDGGAVAASDQPYSGGPVAALRRIAFLLERAREDTYKVKAYRAAAATILPLPPEEIAERAAGGTLGDLPGVGASTAAVIEVAAAGRMPDRLAELEQRYAGPLASGGRELRSLLRGDLHSHSDWSDGGSPIEEMAITAVELGHDYLVLTDHSPRLKVARGLSAERLARQLEVVDAVNDHFAGGFALLKGIEVDILDDGALDQTDEMLARLDVRVASVHSKLAMDAPAMTRRMVAAVGNPFTNVLGHCTGRLVTGSRGTRPGSSFDAHAVFEACAAHEVAVEINSRPERRDPPTRLLELARDLGCLFSIDSDAHAPGQLDMLDYGCERAEAAGIDPDRIVNTWPRERLLAWAAPG